MTIPAAHSIGIRFRPEQFEIERLLDKYQNVREVDFNHTMSTTHSHTVANGLKVTERLSPKLWAVFKSSIDALEFSAPVELFIMNSAEWNASALAGTAALPHRVILNSGIVRHHTPDELRFVIGHELGHLAFHRGVGARLLQRFPETAEGQSTVPEFLKRRIGVWNRWAESTCDRAGYIATGRNLPAVTSAILALASGLGSDWIREDTDDIEQQIRSLEVGLEDGAITDYSHPIPLIRLAALRHYANFENWGSIDDDAKDASDLEVLKILALHDTPVDGFGELVIKFMTSACVLAQRSRGREFSDQEEDLILNWLAIFTDDPEYHLDECLEAATESLLDLLTSTGQSLQSEDTEPVPDLMVAMVRIIVADGNCTDEERHVAHFASEALGLGKKTVDWMISQELRRRAEAHPQPEI